MMIIPFGLVGAVLGHYLLGFQLTILSLIGLLGLAGILVNDSIILVSRLDERIAHGQSMRDAAIGASCDRLRAVLLTSLTTVGGLAPMLFEASPRAQFLKPMAITIVFGLAVATLFVLFLVPSLFGVGGDIKRALGFLLHGTRKPSEHSPRNEQYREFFAETPLMCGLHQPQKSARSVAADRRAAGFSSFHRLGCGAFFCGWGHRVQTERWDVPARGPVLVPALRSGLLLFFKTYCSAIRCHVACPSSGNTTMRPSRNEARQIIIRKPMKMAQLSITRLFANTHLIEVIIPVMKSTSLCSSNGNEIAVIEKTPRSKRPRSGSRPTGTSRLVV